MFNKNSFTFFNFKNFSLLTILVIITLSVNLFTNLNLNDFSFFEGNLVFFSEELSTTNTEVNTEIVARWVGSGLATAGLGGVGTGIGLVFSGLIKGFSRNPSLKDELFSYAIFGFALTEAIGLFALMMAFMLLYA
jgi:F-type H+-transporting ATPase subunit c